MMFKLYLIIFAIVFLQLVRGQTLRFVVVTESAQQELNSKFSNGLKEAEDSNPGSRLEMKTLNFTRKFSEDVHNELCNVLQSGSYSAIIDMTWGGWIKVPKHSVKI